MDGFACKVGVLERDLAVFRQVVDHMLRGDKAALAVRNRDRVQVAHLAGGQPRALDRRDARGHIAALVAADEVEGQRRVVAGHLVADLAVGHKAELDERLEAVADAEHQAVALAEQFMDGVLDARAAQEGGDELARAVRLVAAREAARDNDHLRAADGAFKLLRASASASAE